MHTQAFFGVWEACFSEGSDMQCSAIVEGYSDADSELVLTSTMWSSIQATRCTLIISTAL